EFGQKRATAADGVEHGIGVARVGEEGHSGGDRWGQAALALSDTMLSLRSLVAHAEGEAEVVGVFHAEQGGEEARLFVQRGMAPLQLARKPARQLVTVEAFAVDGDDQMPGLLLRGERGGYDIELVVRDLVAAVDRAAVNLLGDAQVRLLRLALQA